MFKLNYSFGSGLPFLGKTFDILLGNYFANLLRPITNLLDSSDLELHSLEIVDKLRLKLLDSGLDGFV
jgi:hypothetical protein